jgi:hypothetical protein
MSEFEKPEKTIEQTEQAAQALAAFQDDNMPWEVNQFANYLSKYIGMNPEIVPLGFVNCLHMAIWDFQSGTDGYTNSPLEHPLVGSDEITFSWILGYMPTVADKVFSEKFAHEVTKTMIEIGMVAPPEANEAAKLDGEEVITETIEDIEKAYGLIIEDTLQRLLRLDWGPFPNATPEKIESYFPASMGLVLRNSPYKKLPINIMVDDTEHEAGLLQELLDNQKMHLSGKYWLAMTTDKITPEYAMLTKDHLFLKSTEVIAKLAGGDVEQADRHFAKDANGPYTRANLRLAAYLIEHREVMREI